MTSRHACGLAVLVLVCCLAHPRWVLAGEPDDILDPLPIPEGAETLTPRFVRQAMATGSSWTDLLLAGYLPNDQLAKWSVDFVSRCGSIARKFSIGKSANGVDLWVVEISSNPGIVEAKPNFRYVANMHGNEPTGRMLLPMLAEWLCTNQNTDPRAQQIINGMHLFLMPTMNPDGFAVNSRANAARVDLNRNFPGPFSGSCAGKEPELCSPAALVPAASAQPETRAIINWSLDPNSPCTFAANMHEGAVVVNYPWDGYDDGSLAIRGQLNAAPDHAAYVYLAQVYSKSHPTMGSSREFPNGITNGAAWYPIYNSMQDWDYTAAGCMELTLELSQQKRPATSQLPTIWQQNLSPMLNLPISAVLGGISGTVTNTAGTPLTGATITVSGNSMRTTARGPLAYFNKPSAPGTYIVTATAPGYNAVTATLTVPTDGAGARKDFVLSR